MDQYELIRTAHRVYGKSIRQISRETGHHRKTVRKAIAGIEPAYHRQKEVECPVMGPVATIVDRWLREDRARPKRQRHTARRVYTRLIEEHGFCGAESTVRAWVRRWRSENGELSRMAVVPLDPQVAREAEVDWGGGAVCMQGQVTGVRLFMMRSRYSGKCFVAAYPCERQEMFFDGHIRAFEFFGGVFRELVYDNLKTAVRGIFRGKGRIEQDRFAAFRSFYTFSARFCNPARGNEKGGVEGLIGFVRRNFLVPLPEVSDFDELNRMLLEKCTAYGEHILAGREERRTVNERFKDERDRLLPLPDQRFANMKTVPVKVDRYQTARVDRNRYSVPSAWTGRQIWAHVGCWKVTLYGERRKVAEHRRLFGKSRWQIDPTHYLELLAIRPGAFDASRAMVQWSADWPEDYHRLLSSLRTRLGQSQGSRQFIEILKLHRQYSKESIAQAVSRVLNTQCASFETVRQLVRRQEEKRLEIEPLPAELITGVTDRQVTATDIALYGQLVGGQR